MKKHERKNFTADQHLLPFDGTPEFDTTMKNIAKTGYKGAISLEVMQ